jgi:hypothetical protein
MGEDQAKRMKDFEAENQRLKKLFAGAPVDTDIMRIAMKEKSHARRAAGRRSNVYRMSGPGSRSVGRAR